MLRVDMADRQVSCISASLRCDREQRPGGMVRFSNFTPNCFSSASKGVRPSGADATGWPPAAPIAAWAGDMRILLKLRVKS